MIKMIILIILPIDRNWLSYYGRWWYDGRLSQTIKGADNQVSGTKRGIGKQDVQRAGTKQMLSAADIFWKNAAFHGSIFQDMWISWDATDRIDDAEAKGFLFSYEKLFGVKLKTETDIKNEREGKDNSITRTTRLFYVACTRAQKSLAIIAYTYDCEAVKATAMKNNWFEDDEIRLLE